MNIYAAELQHQSLCSRLICETQISRINVNSGETNSFIYCHGENKTCVMSWIHSVKIRHTLILFIHAFTDKLFCIGDKLIKYLRAMISGCTTTNVSVFSQR